MASIRRNEYLSFAYQRLIGHSGTLVVFGHSLTPDFDQHIIEALSAGETRAYWIDMGKKRNHVARKVAISMLPASSSLAIIREKTRLMEALPQLDLVFFDATTHPLGDPSLRVNE